MCLSLRKSSLELCAFWIAGGLQKGNSCMKCKWLVPKLLTTMASSTSESERILMTVISLRLPSKWFKLPHPWPHSLKNYLPIWMIRRWKMIASSEYVYTFRRMMSTSFYKLLSHLKMFKYLINHWFIFHIYTSSRSLPEPCKLHVSINNVQQGK